jgi:Fe2+ transport system protein FeoA
MKQKDTYGEVMKKLSEMKQGETAIVSSVNGDARYVGRITSIGLTPGCKVSIIKNEKNRMKAIAKALKKYKKEVIQILARIDGVPVDEYECNALTLPIKVLEVMNDKEVQDFLESLGAMED